MTTRRRNTNPALTIGDARAAVRRFGVSPRTTGVPVLPPDATDHAWLEMRRAGLGASETAAVMGLSPFASAFSLWWQKRGGLETEQDRAMAIGHKLEPVIGEIFTDDHPDHAVFRPGARLWRHPDNPWMLATPDYLVVAPDRPTGVIPLECKSDEGGAWGRPGTADVPIHHKIQLVQQMAVMGATTGYLMRLAGKRTSLYRVDWDDVVAPLWADMTSAANTFMATVESGVAPDIDGHAATTHVLIEQHPAVDKGTTETIPDALAVAYRDAVSAVSVARGELDRLKNEIRARAGRAEYVTDDDGRKVAQRRVYKRRGYEVAPTTVDGIHPLS